MSMENFPKKEIVIISAATVAAGIGITALKYIWKSKRENKVVFAEGIDQEAADLYGVVACQPNDAHIHELAVETYDGETKDEEDNE